MDSLFWRSGVGSHVAELFFEKAILSVDVRVSPDEVISIVDEDESVPMAIEICNRINNASRREAVKDKISGGGRSMIGFH